MAGVPLSKGTHRRVEVLFFGADRATAVELLEQECGNNLPFCETNGPIDCERSRYAALKLSAGRLDLLRDAIRLAKSDWRDLLMAADFGHDVSAHLDWMPDKPRK